MLFSKGYTPNLFLDTELKVVFRISKIFVRVRYVEFMIREDFG